MPDKLSVSWHRSSTCVTLFIWNQGQRVNRYYNYQLLSPLAVEFKFPPFTTVSFINETHFAQKKIYDQSINWIYQMSSTLLFGDQNFQSHFLAWQASKSGEKHGILQGIWCCATDWWRQIMCPPPTCDQRYFLSNVSNVKIVNNRRAVPVIRKSVRDTSITTIWWRQRFFDPRHLTTKSAYRLPENSGKNSEMAWLRWNVPKIRVHETKICWFTGDISLRPLHRLETKFTASRYENHEAPTNNLSWQKNDKRTSIWNCFCLMVLFQTYCDFWCKEG